VPEHLDGADCSTSRCNATDVSIVTRTLHTRELHPAPVRASAGEPVRVRLDAHSVELAALDELPSALVPRIRSRRAPRRRPWTQTERTMHQLSWGSALL
jgi:hypothetical protein